MEKVNKDAQHIISITKHIPVPAIGETIGPLFTHLMTYIDEKGANCVSHPFVSYKNINGDGEIDGNTAVIEVGFPIDKMVEPREDIKSYTLPPYCAFRLLYEGEHDRLIKPFRRIMKAIQQEKGQYQGIIYEYYLTGEDKAGQKQQTILEVPYH